MADYTSGAGPVGNTSGSAQQVGGTNRLAQGQWQLTPELIAEIQPYLSFDLSKVVKKPTYMQGSDIKYLIPGASSPGQMTAPKNQDVTKEYSAILMQIRSRDRPDVYGTAGSASGQSAAQAFHEVYGGGDQMSGGDALFRPRQAATFDASGVAYDAAGKPIARPENQWGVPEWMQPNRPGFVRPDSTLATSQGAYADRLARQFQVDNPGYFQVGENPNNPGSWDRGALDTNNLPASYFPNGVSDPNSMVKYDPKYGYIAPIALQKQSRPDFLSKYGQYIPLAMFGAGVALSGMTAGAAGSSGAAGGAGATGGTFSGLGAGSTTGSLGLSSAGATGAATGSTVAGGTGIAGGISTAGSGAAAGFGIPAGGYAGAGITAAGQYTSGAGAVGNSAGTAQQVGSQGLFSQPAAPVSTGVPSSTGAGTGAGPAGGGLFGGGGSSGTGLLGQLGSALGGGSGGGYAGLLSTLIQGGASIYQARQIADAMEIQDKSTDFSKTSGGHTSFDPSIRGLQDQSLSNTAAQERGVMGYGSTFRARSDENKDQYDKLYAELTSNQNPYIQARVNPLKEQIAGSRGQIQRNQGLRGVSGSSFGNDELTNFDFGAQRQLGDAGALATNDALGARRNTLGSLTSLNQNRLAGDTQITNTLNTLNSNRTGIAKDRAALEQAGLGLSATSEAATRLSETQKQQMYSRLLDELMNGQR